MLIPREHKTQTKNIIYVSVLVAVVVIASVAAYIYLTPGTTAQPIVIGVPSDFSKIFAQDSTEFYNAMVMATEEINAGGGVLGRNLTTIKVDTAHDASQSVSAVTKLIETNGVDAILTFLPSGPPYPEIPAIRQSGLSTGKIPIFMNFADTASWQQYYVQKYGVAYCQENYWFSFFIGYPPMETLATSLFQWLDELNLTPRTVYMITDDYINALICANQTRIECAQRNYTIVGEETLPLQTGFVEWGPTLSTIKALNPRIILNFDWVPINQAAFIEQFERDPSQSLVYLQYGPAEKAFMDALGDKANTIVWSVAYTGNGINKEAVDFRAKYKSRYGAEPRGASAGAGYDFAYIYTQAIKRAGTTDSKKVAAEIEKTSYLGVFGRTELQEYHIAKGGANYIASAVQQIMNQTSIVVWPSNLAGTNHFVKQSWEP